MPRLFYPPGGTVSAALTRSPAPGGRLTLTSGTPVTTSDVTAAGTLYYTPCLTDAVALWDGSAWGDYSFAETSLSLTLTAANTYDVFGYVSSGVLALETLVWSTATTRATAITVQDGRYCKSGDKTRLYLGTIYASGTNTTEDSDAKRFVWNMYNRVAYRDARNDTTDTWTNAGNGTWSAINGGNATWKHEFVRGLDVEPIHARNHLHTGSGYYHGVALDSTSAIDRAKTSFAGHADATAKTLVSTISCYPGVGYHYVQGVQTTSTASSGTAFGDNGGGIGGGNSPINAMFISEGWR